jgi:hypothetical protein
MTRRRIVLALSVLGLLLLLAAIGTLIFFLNPPSRTARLITITPVRVSRAAGGILADVAITNISAATLRYFQMRRDLRIRIETKNGFVTNSFPQDPRLRGPLVLPPGSNDLEHVRLPGGAIRFQLLYTVPMLSPRDSLRTRMSPKLFEVFGPMLSPLLSAKPAPDLEVTSDLFPIPDHIRTSPIIDYTRTFKVPPQ